MHASLAPALVACRAFAAPAGLPAAQLVQTVAESAAEYVPVAQSMQTDRSQIRRVNHRVHAGCAVGARTLGG